jgi:hypothetical protein
LQLIHDWAAWDAHPVQVPQQLSQIPAINCEILANFEPSGGCWVWSAGFAGLLSGGAADGSRNALTEFADLETDSLGPVPMVLLGIGAVASFFVTGTARVRSAIHENVSPQPLPEV